MKEDGWDGYEDPNKLQWTLTGSLFYSIIVITTIGKYLFVLSLSFISISVSLAFSCLVSISGDFLKSKKNVSW